MNSFWGRTTFLLVFLMSETLVNLLCLSGFCDCCCFVYPFLLCVGLFVCLFSCLHNSRSHSTPVPHTWENAVQTLGLHGFTRVHSCPMGCYLDLSPSSCHSCQWHSLSRSAFQMNWELISTSATQAVDVVKVSTRAPDFPLKFLISLN